MSSILLTSNWFNSTEPLDGLFGPSQRQNPPQIHHNQLSYRHYHIMAYGFDVMNASIRQHDTLI